MFVWIVLGLLRQLYGHEGMRPGPATGAPERLLASLRRPMDSRRTVRFSEAIETQSGFNSQRYNFGLIGTQLLYRYYRQGTAVGEAGVNAMTAPATKFVTFAETRTGVAYANPSTSQSALVTVTVVSSAGTRLARASFVLAPGAHGAANLAPLLGLQAFQDLSKSLPRPLSSVCP